MSKTINTLEDHRVEVYIDKYLQPADARAIAAEIIAEANKAEAAKAKAEELAVFAGAKGGDLFISRGVIFVLADPTLVGYPEGEVHLWRVQDENPSHAMLTYWKGQGYKTFKKVDSYGGSFYTSTVERRGKFVVSL